MSTSLRNSIWSAVYTRFFSSFEQGTGWPSDRTGIVAKLGHVNFFKLPIDDLPEYGFEYTSWTKAGFFKAPWYQVYDYIEWLGSYGAHWERWQDGRIEHDNARNFREDVNSVLEEENSAYRFVGATLAPVAGPAEIDEVKAALAKTDQFVAIGAHINAALTLLADRNKPDFRNSIKESISAVEAAARIVTGDPKATLGDALKRLGKETDLHSALKEGFSKLYGWTSDANGIRHSMMELHQLSLADARYMLVTCSAFANYLIDRAATK